MSITRITLAVAASAACVLPATLRAAGLARATTPAAQTAAPAPDEKKRAGIYLVAAGTDGAEQLVRIAGSKPREVRTTGMAKMVLTQGIMKGAMKAELSGRMADVRTTSSPKFYFYFDPPMDPTTMDPMAMMGMMVGTMSGDAMPMWAKHAAEFQLVRLTVTEDARQCELGKLGASGGKIKNSVQTVVERVAQGAYRLRPKAALKPGEYVFLFANSMGPAMSGSAVWDFGVDGVK